MPVIPVTLIRGDTVDSRVEYGDAIPVNMYAVKKQINQAQGYMTTYPGLTAFGTAIGIDRGAVFNERLNTHIRLSGTSLLEIEDTGDVTGLGTVTGTDQATLQGFTSFNTQGIIADGKMYLYEPVGGLVQVTDPDLGTPIDGVWINGYYFLTDGEYLYHTDIDDETAIDPLKYATAEFMPDATLGVAKTQDNKVVVFGRYSIEYFSDVANPNFAFTRIESRAQKIGIVATHAKTEMDGSFYIVGGRKNESISIHKIDLGSSTRIATRTVDQLIGEYEESDLADMRVESKIEEGTKFVIFHFPDYALCYNATIAEDFGNDVAWSILRTDVLGESPYRAINGIFDPRIPGWVYGDKTDDSMGIIDPTVTTHYGESVEWVLYTPFLYMETMSIDELSLGTIPGFNTEDDATIAISITYDGVVYSQEYWFDTGVPGDFTKRFIRYRLGYVPYFIGFKFRGIGTSRMTIATMGVVYS